MAAHRLMESGAHIGKIRADGIIKNRRPRETGTH